MRMRILLAGGAMSLALVGLAQGAVTVVADYGADFQTTTPKTGWAYQTGTITPVGFSATLSGLSNLSPTTNLGGDYEGSSNTLGSSTKPGMLPAVTNTSLYPTTDGVATVLSYQFTAAQIAQFGNDLKFHTYSFSNPANSGINLHVSIYANGNAIIPPGSFNFGPGQSFSDAVFGQDYDFGPVVANERFQIAFTADNVVPSVYTTASPPMSIAYQLGLVPEPTSLSLAGIVLGGLMLRRRRA